VFSEAISGESEHKPVQVESLEKVCRQTDQSKSEAVVRQLPLVEVWEVAPTVVSRCVEMPLVVRQSPASKESVQQIQLPIQTLAVVTFKYMTV
jgi:hypothetical protein